MPDYTKWFASYDSAKMEARHGPEWRTVLILRRAAQEVEFGPGNLHAIAEPEAEYQAALERRRSRLEEDLAA